MKAIWRPFLVTIRQRAESTAEKLRTRRRATVAAVLAFNGMGDLLCLLLRAITLGHGFGKRRLPDAPARVLLIRADRIGDMILTTPAFPLLRERFSGRAHHVPGVFPVLPTG